ncbi:MAG: hypothetical protein ACLT98_10265 [Eggerthellaceae bacterium]
MTAESLYTASSTRLGGEAALGLRRAFFVVMRFGRAARRRLGASRAAARPVHPILTAWPMPASRNRPPRISLPAARQDARGRLRIERRQADFADDALASMMLSYAAAARTQGADASKTGCGAGGILRPTPPQSPRPTPATHVPFHQRFQRVHEDAGADIAARRRGIGDFTRMGRLGEFSLALKRSNVERVGAANSCGVSLIATSSWVNDEEFDYVYYCCGLSLFGSMPLVEPLEYADDGRIRDFVIAIDTSASTKGDTAASSGACDILRPGMFCDSQICLVNAMRGCSRASPKRGGSAHGPGPSISRASEERISARVLLRRRACRFGRLPHLKGLLYSADGQKPIRGRSRYDVAFVLTDDAYAEEPDVPPWAMRVERFRRSAGRQGGCAISGQAKEEVARAVKVYLAKDDNGSTSFPSNGNSF